VIIKIVRLFPLLSDSWAKFLVNQRLIFLVTLTLVALLAYRISVLVWQFVPEPDLSAYQISPGSNGKASSEDASLTTQQKVEEIIRAHLFGQVRQQTPTAVEVKDAPKSNLNYKVRGIYYSEDQALASVILEKNARDTQFYRLGDEIDRNIFIDQIQPDHILISRNGKLEKLVLEKPTAELNQMREAMSSVGTSNLPTATSTKILQSYRRRYSNNPMALARRFQAIPVEENGRNIGFKLKALRGESLLKKLDFQEDDVFLEVNGISLSKPFEALDALKSLTTAKSVSLTVLRNGNRENLDFTLE
jgi:general secretion pathway protein C